MTMQNNYFTVLFFIKKAKVLKNGEAPICMRITMKCGRAETNIKRSVDPAKWSAAKECSIGREHKYLELNRYIDVCRTKVLQIHRELEQEGAHITPMILKRMFNGEGEDEKMLLEVFAEENVKMRELLGKDYVLGTVLRYERTVKYLGEFFWSKYKVKDIPFRNLNNEHITNFEHFIKVEKKCAQNATVKYLKNLKKITRIALANKWISEDPFVCIKFKQTQSNRAFLTEDELKMIMNKEFIIPRMASVRDIFVFCSLTGLAFTDVKHLRAEHISQDMQGDYWIRKPREKTSNMCSIPLMDIPRQILEKYKDNPECTTKGMLLPIPSNQRMNSYLKEIADICGINKDLTTHVARHTFACIAIANKVSMESIAKMLGHNDLRTTKIYAKLLDETVANEMSVLKQKFAIL